MALLSLSTVFFLVCAASAQISTTLVGTWSTKSAKVLTGPGFYNPVNDSFIEPSHTGISYSFTADGFYEEAHYRAISNPTKPQCPEAIMQFQHGTFVQNVDGSLSLTPFSVDGRQLQSAPCEASTSTYIRYNQSETFQKYQVYTDPYTKMTRLDLYKFDGSPMNPMFLAFSPPQMLPTITMNPTATPTATSSGGKAKRTVGAEEAANEPLNKNAWYLNKRSHEDTSLIHRIDPNFVFYIGIAMCAFGGAAYIL
jgi:hypothetical protein